MRRSLLLAALLTAGCGGPTVVSVSGQVTMDGKPLPGAHVTFQPVGGLNQPPGSGSYAKTDADGRYTLRLIQPDRAGAVVGKHKVSISKRGGEASQQSDAGIKIPPDPVPAKYNRESTLEYEVPPGGTDKADFELTSK